MIKDEHSNHSHGLKLSSAGVLVTLGIIYGDIGTSPLYVMKSIIGNAKISEELVFGGLSCVFWTITLQTTLKYVILTLQADNNGEGGIFSLYTLIRKQAKWLIVPAMIGGAALLADGIITPPISVSSAIEGLRIINPSIPVVPIVMVIISLIFLFQRFGTAVVGKAFGPVMMVWFVMLAALGINQIIQLPNILLALSPHYAFQLLAYHPEGFWLLGAVFLCTTGAEALYSDLGHCGKSNIRISWIFVKTCLLLNYMGQGAWLMANEGKFLVSEGSGHSSNSLNPFYTIMPEWFLVIGIGIATLATIIASQALITGSFTLVGEAIRLNIWPKVRLNYPSDLKGQIYVPSVNTMLWAGCIFIVWYFQESSNMEAAYGLSITLAMLMTTILMSYFLVLRKNSKFFIGLFLVAYLIIELSFFVANMTKFTHGGYVTLIIGSLIVYVMWVWLKSTQIKDKLTEYVKISDHLENIKQLSIDETVPKFATNLVFLTSANKEDEIEEKIIYSIFQKQPKRADIYWLAHVEVTDEPYTMEYKVNVILREDLVKITFKLGFRVEQKVSMFLRLVVEEMVRNQEVDISSRYDSLQKQNRVGDFRFVVLERFLSNENDLPLMENMAMSSYFFIKEYTPADDRWFGLDASNVLIEKVPLLIRAATDISLKRIY